MSHNYDSHARSLRPNPTGGDPHIGSSFSEQGRTTLPPLTIAFPTSDSPGLSSDVAPTHVDSIFGSSDSHRQLSRSLPVSPTLYSSAIRPPLLFVVSFEISGCWFTDFYHQTRPLSSRLKLDTQAMRPRPRTSNSPTRDTLVAKRTVLPEFRLLLVPPTQGDSRL
ncbi:hypothetical protein BC834DRAFT_656995 [Gloeopeniophorella convolvens]|nr:hypothetical protein BC834DRAFT_656995 [Gloeopeniophorella convolvens]